MVITGPTRNRLSLFRDRGFESLPLRHHEYEGRIRRDAREAEGARLEIVCTANNGTEGSNPSLSAI